MKTDTSHYFSEVKTVTLITILATIKETPLYFFLNAIENDHMLHAMMDFAREGLTAQLEEGHSGGASVDAFLKMDQYGMYLHVLSRLMEGDCECAMSVMDIFKGRILGELKRRAELN